MLVLLLLFVGQVEGRLLISEPWMWMDSTRAESII
jgi:hypothetical protein